MKQKSSDESGLIQSTPLYLLTTMILLAVLAVSVLIAVTFGTVKIPVSQVYQVIMHELFGAGSPDLGTGSVHDVIWLIRLPRLILAIAVGMGLSVCGVVMQAIVKNPLADPYILGVSSGASLGATVAIMLGVGAFLGAGSIGICAFVGAFGISLLVLLLSNVGGRSNSIKLLLAGMALSSVCSAFSSFVVYFANDKEGMQTLTYWLMGSLAGAKWQSLSFIFPIVLLSVLFFWTQYRSLNLMLLGDEVSITLGTDLHRRRQGYLLLTSLVIGFVVYASGMIGFVGLVVPHLVRMLFGTDHKKLLPLSALTGAIFLVWADVLCRVIIPNTELPIGILISMIGGPCFIFLMTHKKYGFGGGRS
ncbi:MAG: iron ABC transporter permease [Oscillospiraceae bacterium]|nr:iron ABC transporter permease [Oscillospiraceae bacterium]